VAAFLQTDNHSVELVISTQLKDEAVVIVIEEMHTRDASGG
jgi:hypothetical protein